MPKVSQTDLIAAAIGGKVVSFPTDTVPALATLPNQAERIFTLKQRSPDKPLILMAAEAVNLWDYVKGTPAELEIWQQIARQYWPGQLTLVLPASSLVPPCVNPTDPTTIGLRVPNSRIAQGILAQTGVLGTTSANLSGQPPLEMMGEIATTFPNVYSLNCDELEKEGKLGNGLPSTVAKWTGTQWHILRQGNIRI